MAAYDYTGTGEHPAPKEPQPTAPWWEGPKPANWPPNVAWPPPLPPGASYGPNQGQIIYGPDSPGAPGSDHPWTPGQPLPGVPPVPPTTVDPVTPPVGPGAPAPPGGGLGDYTLPGAPVFTPPGYTPPPAFAYSPFEAPTGDAVLSDPGYQFRQQQGQQALLNNRAARGVLNTGGTLKDFLGYNQAFATQEYGNVWDRAANAYKTNRGNALDTYNTNYKTQYIDPYQISFQNAQAEFAPKMAEYSTTAAWNQHANDQSQALAWNSLLNDEDQYWKKIDWGTANA